MQNPKEATVASARQSVTEPQPVVSAVWLKEHLNDPQVAIADCRFSLADPELGHKQYQASHIQGAYYLDLNRDLSSPGGAWGRYPLPNPTELQVIGYGVNFRRWSSLTTIHALLLPFMVATALPTWGITGLPQMGVSMAGSQMGIPLQTQFLSLR